MPVDIRRFDERDRVVCESLMDAFQDELVAMDPYHREIRGDGYGVAFVNRMVRDAAGTDGLALVAERDGRLVGFGAGAIRTLDDLARLMIIDHRTGDVIELYVVPDERGRGIGRALLERLERHFRERSCGAIEISVFAYNSRAREFYSRAGYGEREIMVFKTL